MQTLPIEVIKTDFLEALTQYTSIVLTAEPGAGKSTCLPLWLLSQPQFSGKKIYLLQPRRIAVKKVAQYLASQLGENVGQRVGYRLRNDSAVSNNTQLEVVTEGILIQVMQNDPELSSVAMVIIDEFHERSLQADMAFALARDIQQGLRDDLILLLMSATLANEQVQRALPDAYFLHSEGRAFPVSVEYQPTNNTRFWREHALKVIENTAINSDGSILVFLPGSGDIKYFAEKLVCDKGSVVVCPLYGDLTLNTQQQAILPAKNGQQKIVLATNIAETSLTIEGISTVIDCGLEKVAVYDEQTLTNNLVQRNIAKSSATQRMGRAGRLASGHCIRLYGEEDFQRRPDHNSLDIHQADILPMVIEAARWGISTLHDLPLLDKPRDLVEQNAWQVLQDIDVVDAHRRLTQHGETVAQLGCHPRFAHMIISAKRLEKTEQISGLAYLACILAALLEERDLFKGESARFDCDLRHRVSTLLKQSEIYRHQQVLKQAARLAKKAKLSMQKHLPIEQTGLLLFLAYPQRLAKTRATYGDYIASYGKGLSINEQDALANEPTIVAAHLSQFHQKLMVRLAAPVDINLLVQYQLVSIEKKVHLAYETKTKKVVAAQRECIGSIILAEQPFVNELDNEQLFSIWFSQIEQHSLAWLNWSAEDKSLLLRWQWLNQTQIHLVFPDVSDTSLMAQLDKWLAPFIIGITTKKQLDKIDLSTCLLSLLDYPQQAQFDKIVPEYFIGPTGRRCPIRYSLEQVPIVSLPMQEVYGMQQSPVVGEGQNKVSVTLELLSPAQRPIQITQDLSGFWQGSYKEVQKEMKAKYPKHFWPDDPATAKPTNKTKRHLS